MTKRLWLAGAALAACGLLAADRDKPGPADDDPPAPAKDTDQGDGVADIVTAYRLADWARRMDPPSPFALVTAAEMLHRTSLFAPTDAQYPKDHFRGPPSTHKQDPKTAFQADVDKLLDEAVRMAKANKQDVATVQAMAKGVREGRGGLYGPLMYTMELAPGQTDAYSIKFKKGEWVRIAVRNGGDSRLHVKVVNDRGDRRADDAGVDPQISFVPRPGDGADYTVRVTNEGAERVVYQLFTN